MTSSAPRVGSLNVGGAHRRRLAPPERRALIRPLLAYPGQDGGWPHRRCPADRLGTTCERSPRASSGSRARSLRQRRSEEAEQRLSPALLHHSYRTYLFGAAIAHLKQVDVDRELLLASALCTTPASDLRSANVDFTLASAKLALEVAERVGFPRPRPR